MSWSFSEIRSLSVKATKGAGLPWGLAEEAGFAVEWLERNGACGVDVLAAYLQETETNSAFTADKCPITQGTWISDTGASDIPSGLEVFQPMLLVPFLALTCERKQFSLKWSDGQAMFNDLGLLAVSGNDRPSAAEALSLKEETRSFMNAQPTIRVPAERGSAVAILNRFAGKTYAPATEESRLAGAGAGTSDND